MHRANSQRVRHGLRLRRRFQRAGLLAAWNTASALHAATRFCGGHIPGPTGFRSAGRGPAPGQDNDRPHVRQAMRAAREALDNRADRPAWTAAGSACDLYVVGASLNFWILRRARPGKRRDCNPYALSAVNPATAVAAAQNTGPAQTVVKRPSSGRRHRPGGAWIRKDRVDVVLAGGADELSENHLRGLHPPHDHRRTPLSPLRRARRGLNLGEGPA